MERTHTHTRSAYFIDPPHHWRDGWREGGGTESGRRGRGRDGSPGRLHLTVATTKNKSFAKSFVKRSDSNHTCVPQRVQSDSGDTAGRR